MMDEDIIEEFAATEEYKKWLDSLFAVIGYATNEEIDDEELITEFMADHIIASLELSKGLKKIRYITEKRQNKELQEKNK